MMAVAWFRRPLVLAAFVVLILVIMGVSVAAGVLS